MTGGYLIALTKTLGPLFIYLHSIFHVRLEGPLFSRGLLRIQENWHDLATKHWSYFLAQPDKVDMVTIGQYAPFKFKPWKKTHPGFERSQTRQLK